MPPSSGTTSSPWLYGGWVVAVADFLYLVYFETAFSAARAWSIWSYAYVAVAAVVI
jgi:hypothetical protein